MAPRQNHRHADPSKAIAYLRVSTEDQRLGPEAQRAAIDAWAARQGITVVGVHIDQGVSGGSDIVERPALVAALMELRVAGAGVLLVAKRDRLARDVYVASTIERAVAQCGARVASADGTANGDNPADAFMRTILDGAAAYERALIRTRTRAALAVKNSRGERVGAVPFGYRVADDGDSLVRDDAEHATIIEAVRLRSAGLSFRKVRDELTSRQMVSRRGTPLGLQAVYAIVTKAQRQSSAC